MHDHARETLRQRLERALDAMGLRPAPARPALQLIPLGPGRSRRAAHARVVRPVRAWSRLVRI